MTTDKTLWVKKDLMAHMRRCLNEQPATREDCLLGEDDTLSVTADFGDGMKMDIKVCGVQFQEGEDNRAFSEAVLFKNGAEVAHTDAMDTFDEQWVLSYGENTYFVDLRELPGENLSNKEWLDYIRETHGNSLAYFPVIETDGIVLLFNILDYYSKQSIPSEKMLETLVELFDGLGIDREEIGTLALCSKKAETSSEDVPEPIYTRDEAAGIVELFEDILDENEIHVPSPEEDQRDPDNMIGMYGSTYYDLLDGVEATIQELLERHTPDTEVIPDEFSGTA